ncbi:MAG: hypothetical protein JXB35_05200 [Anaerolineae bacterium]|nr:hypothetical protein [Anaerolineae bacterium]
MSSKRLIGLRLGLIVLVAAGFLLVRTGMAQSPTDYRYFPETGHGVSGEFLTYFNLHGGLEIFGYPITEPFVDRGVPVQYFQNARFEAHPNNPAAYRVQLGLLADELRYRQPAASPPSPPSAYRHFFPETGHIVSFAFLDFFKSRGGIDIFGYPVTEMHFEDGRIVQYFQRLKLEWHPEDYASPVHVGALGQSYVNAYRQRFPPEAFAAPSGERVDSQGAVGTALPLGLRVVVSVRYSVLGYNTNQTVSVRVTDGARNPVSNSRVNIELTAPSGQVLGSSSTILTDADGFAKVAIALNGGENGQRVVVRATATHDGQQASGEGVFLLWW